MLLVAEVTYPYRGGYEVRFMRMSNVKYKYGKVIYTDMCHRRQIMKKSYCSTLEKVEACVKLIDDQTELHILEDDDIFEFLKDCEVLYSGVQC